MPRGAKTGILTVSRDDRDARDVPGQQVDDRDASRREVAERTHREGGRVPESQQAAQIVEDAAPDKGFRAQVVVRHMHGQRQVVSGRRLADRHGGSGVGGGEVPGHDEKGYLVVVAALQRAASGIELVTQALRGNADPLPSWLGYTLGRLS